MKTRRRIEPDCDEDRFQLPDYLVMLGVGCVVTAALVACETVMSLPVYRHPQLYLAPKRDPLVGLILHLKSQMFFRYSLVVFGVGLVLAVCGQALRVVRNRAMFRTSDSKTPGKGDSRK